MTTKSTIDQIVQELCEMEPALVKKQAEVRKLVAALIQQKPVDVFDQDFARRLRQQLMTAEQPSPLTFMQTLTSYRPQFTYALSGALVAVVLMVPFLYSAKQPTAMKVPAGLFATLNSQQAFAPQSGNAFGSLATLASSARTQSGGGGGGGITIPTTNIATDEKMIAPYYQPYVFVYKGDPLTITDADREVYKRVKGFSAGSLTGLATQFGGGLIDIGSFSNAQIRGVDIYEDRDQGYNINVNFTDGIASIGPNYEKWFTERTTLCAKGFCPEPEKIRLDQIPADAELIRISNAFLAEHGIDTSSYGEPTIDTSWRTWYEQSPDKANYYFPETYGVIYPYKLKGMEVRDSGAGVYGLRVDVHVPDNKVFSVYNLSSQQYQTSSYATEQDTARITKVAERGGFYGWWGTEENNDATQVGLGTPTEVLMQFYRYDGVSSEELYVPALVFPVLDAPKDMYVPTQVIVPIIKEILDAQESQVIMPLSARTGLGGGSAVINPAVSDPAAKEVPAPMSEPKQ